MTSLTVNVPEELAIEVDSWEDGAEYTLTVKQTSAGQFDLIAGETAESEDEGEEDVAAGAPAGGSKKMPAAIAVLIGKAK